MAQAVFAGLSLRTPVLEPGLVQVEFVVTKWHWDSFFFEFLGFPLSILILPWLPILIQAYQEQ
jgi:hypothetical protein